MEILGQPDFCHAVSTRWASRRSEFDTVGFRMGHEGLIPELSGLRHQLQANGGMITSRDGNIGSSRSIIVIRLIAILLILAGSLRPDCKVSSACPMEDNGPCSCCTLESSRPACCCDGTESTSHSQPETTRLDMPQPAALPAGSLLWPSVAEEARGNCGASTASKPFTPVPSYLMTGAFLS